MIEKRKKRSGVSFKDVQIAYLCSGMEPIKQMYSQKEASVNTIRRALHNLKSNGSPVESLEKWFMENFGSGTRGRAAPKAGQERVYRAQQINSTGPFLRLPLSALKIDKGQEVNVIFESDRILVRTLV